MRVKCANVKEDAIREAIAMLPEKEKLAEEACLSAARCKSGNGIRYTTQWIYECLLLRIKSKKAYSHLRRHKILILPSLQTLHRYMKVIKGAYGFQDYVFEALKQKTANMSPQSVRGVLLLDEMKLSKALKFNAQTLQFEGFTNLGKYTPEHQKGTRGDHALVIMFQPFRGKWVQSLACFLSKDSASSGVLHKLIIECIILTENAGLYIDAVTTDGASWNRFMWNLFGVDKETVSVTHVVDDSRRLWFLSDFPHLIKCVRNFFVKHLKYDPISTPDGFTFLKHWFALLLIEDPASYKIKVNFKLRKEHIQPKYFQKMNVALAFQFFGVADALEVFRNRHKDLKDCEGSIQLCRRIKGLITAMNNRTPLTALSTGNKHWHIITEFLDYLEKWKSITKETGHEFITQNSYYGLMISLKATLQICTFLIDKCGFDYLMTARLHQDNLERFFGMMRDSCGSNDHPDANLFIQMYRLISTYSLVKPPKGCNVSGGELLDVLLNIKEIGNIDERKEQFESQIDTILDTGCGSNVLNNAVTLIQDHDYCESEASSYALSYISGYVARKGSRFAKFICESKPVLCTGCIASLVLSPTDVIPERHKLIGIKSQGYLKHPSLSLYSLIEILETAIIEIIKSADINPNIIFQVTDKLEDLDHIPLVGCDQHQLLLTRRILVFYLTIRMHFISKQSNKNDEAERRMTQEKRKSAKLVSKPDGNVQREANIIPKRRVVKRKSSSELIKISGTKRNCH